MAKFINFNGMLARFKENRFSWYDRLTFLNIFVLWASIIVVFGLAYFFLSSYNSNLFSVPAKEQVGSISDHIYFSFITATTTGFGDIVPTGFFKLVAIVEVIFGLLLLAIVTSKLVSIKQDMILTEIYEISFNEKINRMRSSLLVFRQHLSRLINNVESNQARKREIHDIYIYLSSFEDILNEIASVMEKPQGKFTNGIDPLNTEILFNSVLSSFEKLNELLNILNQQGLEWKRDIVFNLINNCVGITDSLYNQIRVSKILSEKEMTDLIVRKNKAVEALKDQLAVEILVRQSKNQKGLGVYI